METTGTIVIGGGISGLACAARLCRARSPMLVITDRLGGRMYHAADGSINFGATYVTEDYRNVLRYVDRGIRFRLRQAYRTEDGGIDPLVRWHNARHWRPMLGLVRRLRQLRGALQRFRREAEQTSQAELLPRYPLLTHYTRQSAADLIAELNLQRLHERYFTLAFQATCFTDPLAVNAFFYLVTLFPIIMRVWVADFTRTYARLTAGYEDRIRTGYVQSLERAGHQWCVHTATGEEYISRNVVIAAPYHNASRFYPVPKPYLSPSATILSVEGERQAVCARKSFLVSPPQERGVALVWQQRSGLDLVFSVRDDPDLSATHCSPKIRQSVSWKTAVVVSGPSWAPLELEPGIYLAGDYNLCGLEDSFINGLCAANQILKQPREAAR